MASGDPGRFGGVGDDTPPEPLGDPGNEAVAEGTEALHPFGRPIIHSHADGQIGPAPNSAAKFRQPGCFIIEAQVWLAVSVGVANQPQAGSVMRGAEVGCAKHAPCRIEPERGQVPENLPEPVAAVAVEQPLDVLHENVTGS
jgi:hypothetical protein